MTLPFKQFHLAHGQNDTMNDTGITSGLESGCGVWGVGGGGGGGGGEGVG